MSSPEISTQNMERTAQSEFREPESLFRTRAYEILALSTDPKGIQFITGKTLPRPKMRQRLLAEGEYGKKILDNITEGLEKSEIPANLQTAIEKGIDFSALEKQIEIWRELGVEITEEQIAEFKKTLSQRKVYDHRLLSEADRSRYVREMEGSNKFALSNVAVSRDGNTIIADINKVPFMAYKYIRKPEDVKRGLIDLANPTGVCNILETTEPEGSPHNFFGMGRRYPENGTYRASKESGGEPGALGAGIMDAKFSRHTAPGQPERLNNRKIFNAGDKELFEEAGFSSTTSNGEIKRITTEDIKAFGVEKIAEEAGPTRNDIASMKIVCFGRDLVQPHNEIGISAVSPKSRQELEQIHAKMTRIEDERNFSEGMFYIPATPDAVEKFITKCRTPMPPTHYMPLIAAMYEKIATSDGGGPEALKRANEWKVRVQQGSDKLWEEVDAMVAQYYIDHPEAIEQNKKEAKRDSINTKGFDPAVLSDKQIMEKQPDGSYKPITLNGELELLGFVQE